MVGTLGRGGAGERALGEGGQGPWGEVVGTLDGYCDCDSWRRRSLVARRGLGLGEGPGAGIFDQGEGSGVREEPVAGVFDRGRGLGWGRGPGREGCWPGGISRNKRAGPGWDEPAEAHSWVAARAKELQ